jgi:Nif-specific regulatory protein
MKESLDRAQEVLQALSRISQTINTLQEIDPLLEKIMDIAVEAVGAERGFILLLDDNGEVEVRTARNMSESSIADLREISNSVVEEVLRTGEVVLSYDAQVDERFRSAESIVMHRIQSVACVPLKLKERPVGAIYLDSVSRRGGFTADIVPFLTAFANQAAIAIENAQLYETLREENRRLRKQAQKASGFSEIVGQSPKMRRLFDVINSVIDSDATVLIQGESGTGKELVARAIHYNGPRKDEPFLALFCGSLPESLLESELFGHKRGSFTGATTDKKGLFEAAHGGTLFLDEIADLSMTIQTQLLRVLQEGEIKRIGETHVRKVDVRIIAASNRELTEEVKAGRFREDLYYRLNVITIRIPPLRERPTDIPLLAHHFLDKYASRNRKEIKGFSPEAMRRLSRYSWPGNVRELENTVERAVVLSKGSLIGPEDLQLPEEEEGLPAGLSLKEFERRIVLKTLNEAEGNISEAARQLGVSRRWLHYRLKEWKHEKD